MQPKTGKIKLRKLFAVLLTLAMTLSALSVMGLTVSAFTSGDFEFRFTNGTEAEIIGYTGLETDLVIPSKLDGYTVTNIDYFAFSDCSNLVTITIPSSVIYLDGLFTPSSLTDIYVDANNTVLSSKDGVLFDKSQTELIRYPAGKSVSSYTVPNSVTSIRYSAFYKSEYLERIIFPDNVTSIGNSAFSNCTNLMSVMIGTGVTDIEGYAFWNCPSLTKIDVVEGNVAYSSKDGILFNKTQTQLIKCPEAKSVISYTVPNSVTGIEGRAFYSCTSLESIILPDNITHIGMEAFYNTAYYNTASNWDNGVLYIGNYLIKASNDALPVDYTARQGTKTIADYAFFSCEYLASVTIPDSVISLGDAAFYDCTTLKSIKIGNNMESIGDRAFLLCESLTNITIPDSVTSIGDSAFKFCYDLTDVTIGKNVKTIGNDAFTCSNIESIVVPNGVTSIGNWAFSFCGKLENVIIPKSVTSIGAQLLLYSDLAVIYGYRGSYAESYAEKNGYPFVALKELEDANSKVVVLENEPNVLPQNADLHVAVVETSATKAVYDITLSADNAEIQPNGTVTVKIPVPEAMDSVSVKVYREESDGTRTDMNAIYQDGYMVFTTDHFSRYILVGEETKVPTNSTNPDKNAQQSTVNGANVDIPKTDGVSVGINAAYIICTLVSVAGVLCLRRKRRLTE